MQFMYWYLSASHTLKTKKTKRHSCAGEQDISREQKQIGNTQAWLRQAEQARATED